MEDVNLHFRAEFARFEEWDNQGLMVSDDSGTVTQVLGSKMNGGSSTISDPMAGIPIMPDIGGYDPFSPPPQNFGAPMPDNGEAPF